MFKIYLLLPKMNVRQYLCIFLAVCRFHFFSFPSVTQLRVSRCTSMPATRLACQMAVLSHVQAAVDSPDLPCDVGGLVAGEEADRPGDFFRPAEPTNRDLSTEPFHHFVWDRGQHVGCDIAGSDRVDGQADPVADRALRPGELEDGLPGQGLRQAEEPRLGCGIVGLADAAGFPDRRGHVDDPAGSPLDHVLQRSFGHEECAGKIDREHLLPALVGHLGHGPVDGDARVVDHDVEPAVLVDHLAHDTPAIISVADIPWCTVIRRPGYLAVMSAMNFSAGSWWRQ